MSESTHLTIRDVAKACGVRTHQAKYAAAEYDIAPRLRVGIIRLWSVEDLPRFRSVLSRIAGRREVAHVA